MFVPQPAPSPPPPSPPPPSPRHPVSTNDVFPTFEVVSGRGSCRVKSDGCVYSDDFGTGQEYSEKHDCVIKQNVPFPLDVRVFDVRYDYLCRNDFLKVNGVKHCGYDYYNMKSREVIGAHGATPAAGSELVWHTDGPLGIVDGYERKAGFKICPVSRQPPRH